MSPHEPDRLEPAERRRKRRQHAFDLTVGALGGTAFGIALGFALGWW